MWFKKSKPQPSMAFKATPEMIAEAKANPNGWVYQIAGNFGPDDAVPPECIVGAHKVDEHGQLTGEFQVNPRYRGT